MKIRQCLPRKEFGFGPQDHKDVLAEQLKQSVFEEEEIFIVALEVGNFTPDFDYSMLEDRGQTRWGLRLHFLNRSPIPALNKWHEKFQQMASCQNWETATSWFSQKLHGRGINGWNFKEEQVVVLLDR